MAPNKEVEYIFSLKDGDTRYFQDVESARKFARNNRSRIRDDLVERRVLDNKAMQIDEAKTKLISIDDLLNKDMRKI